MAKLSVLALSLLSLASSAVAWPIKTAETEVRALPLVIWHGLGDHYNSQGLREIAQLADDVNPGTYVYMIRLGRSSSEDRQASFLGNVSEQIDDVCQQLKHDPIVSTAPQINALGFSQGGQFLRAYVERCNDPPVRNLVTFGSQHNGISKFQSCKSTGDWICRGAEALLRFGRWSSMVQSRFVPAQYFRDPVELEEYIENSNFLADINNERPFKNQVYKENLKKLEKFAMFMFEDDTMVVPKESAHFAEVNTTSGEVTPLKERQIYQEDWLGLKTLGEQARLDFITIPGAHMELTERLLIQTFQKYFGPIEVDIEMDGKGRQDALVLQNGS